MEEGECDLQLIGFNPAALACVAVSLGIAVILSLRTRKFVWGPVFAALTLFSGYETLHVKWQEFLYVDDNKSVPTGLHLAHDFYLLGFCVGLLGLAVVTGRLIIAFNNADIKWQEQRNHL